MENDTNMIFYVKMIQDSFGNKLQTKSQFGHLVTKPYLLVLVHIWLF